MYLLYLKNISHDIALSHSFDKDNSKHSSCSHLNMSSHHYRKLGYIGEDNIADRYVQFLKVKSDVFMSTLYEMLFLCYIITRKVVRKELLQEMGEFDWLRKHVLQIDNAR